MLGYDESGVLGRHAQDSKNPPALRFGGFFFGSSYSLPFFLFVFRRHGYYIRFFYNAKYFLLLLYGFCYIYLSLCLYQLECAYDISARVRDDYGRSLDEGISVVRQGIDEFEIAYLECCIALLEALEIDEIDSCSCIPILRPDIAVDSAINTTIVICLIG